MPKPKPDQVIRFEMVLGSAERQILKDMRSAYVFNRVGTPIVDLADSITKDLFTSPRALATFLTFLGLFFDIPYFPDWTDLSELSEEFRKGKEKAEATPPGEDRPAPGTFGEMLYNLRHPNVGWGINQGAVDDFFRIWRFDYK